MKLIIILLFVILSNNLYSQIINNCGQFDMEVAALISNPEFRLKRDTLEAFTAEYTKKYYQRIKENRTESDTPLFVIPVVFHIMHNYGPENISKNQVLDALRIINEDYQKQNADTSEVIPIFKSIIGNCRVAFRLANRDPDGNCTDGITRHATILTYGGDNALKKIVLWPPDRYLNIWVESSASGNWVAYSNFPGSPPELDGVVILDKKLGSIGTSTKNPDDYRVLSHEIGHYFNLLHTWGGSNTAGLSTNCNTDDYVMDTPNTIGSAFICNLNLSSCTPGIIDNVQNIMDYSICDYMFTQGQSTRVQAALYSSIGNRNNLWSLSNRKLTGTNDGYQEIVCVPIADFSNKTFRICQGQTVNFINTSYGGKFTAVNWLFPGANVISSNQVSPTVLYNTPGIYPVSLTVSNSTGNSTIERNNIVEVSPNIGNKKVPTLQDFEDLDFPLDYWNFDNIDGSHWDKTQKASVSGSNSLYLKRDSLNNGQDDIFYTESYDLSDVIAPIFNFKIAFANSSESNDKLQISMSTDCGKSWIIKYSKSGNSLSTTQNAAYDFIPVPSEWRQDGMNVNAAAGESKVRFKFQFSSAGGNNIYIDDINIGGVTAYEEVFRKLLNLSIKPNPVNFQTALRFELLGTAKVSYSIKDITGRTVYEKQIGVLNEGQYEYKIENDLASGLYLLDLNINEQHFIQKLVF